MENKLEIDVHSRKNEQKLIIQMVVLTIKSLALLHMASSTKWLKSHISTFASVNNDIVIQLYVVSYYYLNYSKKGRAGGWKREEDFYRSRFVFFNLSEIFDLGACHQSKTLKKIEPRTPDGCRTFSSRKKNIPGCHLSYFMCEFRDSQLCEILEIRFT